MHWHLKQWPVIWSLCHLSPGEIMCNASASFKCSLLSPSPPCSACLHPSISFSPNPSCCFFLFFFPSLSLSSQPALVSHGYRWFVFSSCFTAGVTGSPLSDSSTTLVSYKLQRQLGAVSHFTEAIPLPHNAHIPWQIIITRKRWTWETGSHVATYVVEV